MTNKKPARIEAKKAIQNMMMYTREKIGENSFDKDLFEIKSINVEINNLNPVFNDYKIINLSDIHLGQWINKEYLDGVIEIVNNENPDLITLTGDYVSYNIDDVKDDLRDCLKNLNAKDGVLSVLGNHDHWLGAKTIKNVLKNAEIKNLSNDVHIINKNEEKLYIAGLDSVTVGKNNLNKVLNKIPDNCAAILLVHEPDIADLISKTNKFSLQISGHSHGGQFIIPGTKNAIFRGEYSKKYPVGEYKIGNMIQYTSKGLGTNNFWFRINCPPEITIFHLKTKKED